MTTRLTAIVAASTLLVALGATAAHAAGNIEPTYESNFGNVAELEVDPAYVTSGSVAFAPSRRATVTPLEKIEYDVCGDPITCRPGAFEFALASSTNWGVWSDFQHMPGRWPNMQPIPGTSLYGRPGGVPSALVPGDAVAWVLALDLTLTGTDAVADVTFGSPNLPTCNPSWLREIHVYLDGARILSGSEETIRSTMRFASSGNENPGDAIQFAGETARLTMVSVVGIPMTGTSQGMGSCGHPGQVGMAHAWVSGETCPVRNPEDCPIVHPEYPLVGLWKLVNGVPHATVYRGDDVTFTVTTMNCGDSTVPAEDLYLFTLLDDLKDRNLVDVRDLTVDGVAKDSIFDGYAIELLVPYLHPGESLTVEFTATVAETAPLGTFSSVAVVELGGNGNGNGNGNGLARLDESLTGPVTLSASADVTVVARTQTTPDPTPDPEPDPDPDPEVEYGYEGENEESGADESNSDESTSGEESSSTQSPANRPATPVLPVTGATLLSLILAGGLLLVGALILSLRWTPVPQQARHRR